LKLHKDNLRVRVSKSQLVSYLGSEPCWIRIEVKGRVFYKEYKGEDMDFDLPREIGVDGEEVEIRIVKITAYDFIRTAIGEGGIQFHIIFEGGKYWLIVDGKEVCKLILKEGLHYDRSDHGPAVILATMDYEGDEHLIKLVFKESKEYVSKVMISHFRRIRSVKYDEKMNRLVIEYFRDEGEETSEHKIYLESPKSVLTRMYEELKSLIKEGIPRNDTKVTRLTGDIGQTYAEFYLKGRMKMKISEKEGIPPEKIEIKGSFRIGPDFLVYHKGSLIVIVDVKSTTDSDEFPKRCFDRARDESFYKKYFPGDYRNVKYGLPVAVFIDLNAPEDASIEEIIKAEVGDFVPNPYYSP